jgi:PAS domain S-box-containing protein
MAAGTRYADIVTYGVAQGVYVDAVGREEEWFAAWMERHRNQPVAEELALTDGRWVLVTEGRMCNGGVSGLRIDITELKQAQAALRESEALLDRAQSIARIGSWELDVATGCYQWSKEMYRIRGLPVDEFEPSIRNLSQYIYPDDRPVARKWVAGLRNGISPGRTEFRIVRPNGDVRWVSVDDGEQTDSVGKLAGTMQDITERRLIEQQLAQAQKMEAIGNLTGGMAHDFNNLLGVISGNLFLLSEALEGNAELKEVCHDAAEAANRGAELTSRLLAFGRRQSLQPQATDINQLITETTKLLARILGEDITVELRLGEGLRSTIVDPAQLEAAIANLVTNARDAMPKGGKLTIATSGVYLDADYAALYPDVAAGDYKLIEVTDTGTGMPPDVEARIFEPFFTTKPLGKGTGLGLSMVFGFIKQSGGHISVYSEPSRGTTIRLYIPYRTDSSEPVAVAPPRRIVGGDEHILLVEDDAAMRRVAARQLKELGYAVSDAASAVLALQILDRGTTFDLLLTDVVMPGEMDGIDLATAAAQRCPRLKVLLMSGFPEARFEQRALGEVRPRLITKPFHRGVLAAVLRELLDAPRPQECPPSPAFVPVAE